MTSETFRNTFYIIHAALINFRIFYCINFIIKCIYFIHFQFSTYNFIFKFSAQNATESNWSRFQWQVLCFPSFYCWKIKLLYLFLHLLIKISPQNHNCNALNVLLPSLAVIMWGQSILRPFSQPSPLGKFEIFDPARPWVLMFTSLT